MPWVISFLYQPSDGSRGLLEPHRAQGEALRPKAWPFANAHRQRQFHCEVGERQSEEKLERGLRAAPPARGPGSSTDTLFHSRLFPCSVGFLSSLLLQFESYVSPKCSRAEGLGPHPWLLRGGGPLKAEPVGSLVLCFTLEVGDTGTQGSPFCFFLSPLFPSCSSWVS